jgi:hypothetical protein
MEYGSQMMGAGVEKGQMNPLPAYFGTYKSCGVQRLVVFRGWDDPLPENYGTVPYK